MTDNTKPISGSASTQQPESNEGPTQAFAAWNAKWITRPVQDHRDWDMRALEVRASLEKGGSAEIWFAVRDGAECRVLRLDAADGSAALYAANGDAREEAARVLAPELRRAEAAASAEADASESALRQAGPNEAEAVGRELFEVAVRIVQERSVVHVQLNGRPALSAYPSAAAAAVAASVAVRGTADGGLPGRASEQAAAGAAPSVPARIDGYPAESEAQVREADSRRGSVGFRSGKESTAVFRELRIFGADDRALYVNRFYDPAALHFGAGSLDLSGNGLRLLPGETALCENPLPVDSPLFRRGFDLPSKPIAATLRAYALGWYELSLNGRRIGDRVLAPANTPYDRRMLVDVYEADELLHLLLEGENVIGASLGNGYNFNYSRWGWKWNRDKALIVQLDLVFADGSAVTVGTDETWSTAPGPVSMHDIYDGETYDARLQSGDWRLPGFPASARSAESWTPAVIAPTPEGRPESSGQPPIRRQEPLEAVCAYQPEPGVTVYDFGQNIAGWARIRVRGEAGERVEIRYGELIDGRGALDGWTNRNASARDVYVLGGQQAENYEPSFTYHGFRYAEVRTTADLSRIQAVPIHADVLSGGSFRSSDPLLEQIQNNIRRSILNNLVSIPTDCCQRDERTPCLMDSAVVEEAAIHNFGMKAYYRKWMADIEGSDSNPDWSGDRVTLPWHLYRYYGDLDLLREGYASMKAYIQYLTDRWPQHIVDEGFGDWCPPNDDGWANYFRDPELVNTSLYAMQADVAAQAAETLGYAEDAAIFRSLAKKVGAAFHDRFYRGNGVYGSGSQTSQILPLAFGLVPEDGIEEAVSILIAAIGQAGRHLDTGIYGTRHLLDVLADHGHTDLAYELLTTKEYPGFGWQIEQGATTLWEQWSFKGGMHSHDHAMFGGIGVSFFTRLAGIVPLEPGYARIGIRPCVPADLDWVRAELDTPAGRVCSGWRREAGRLVIELEIPAGTSAEVTLPGGEDGSRSERDREPNVRGGSAERVARSFSAGRKAVEVGPGRHEFNIPIKTPGRPQAHSGL
ncbi:family 78 glycoside hydrolase catalytic domain [Saccharibacillus sacchari]|uniref:Family 78 glycoside hydrolase catalytic domain n=1 Tax=Saccharibacillus sacchari TaxID=456493 RepID=A0ACC6PHE5_9BACL